MINLLPPDIKADIRYAHRAVTLRRWVVLCIIAVVGLLVIGTYGLFTLQQSTNKYEAKVAQTQSDLQKAQLEKTKQKVQDISSSLKLAVDVLSNEILFSKLIMRMGQVMPSGTILSGLNINKADTGVDISAAATDYNAATQIQVNLADPSNKIFSKVDINNVTCAGGEAKDKRFPCEAGLRGLFNVGDNQFLFINQGAKP